MSVGALAVEVMALEVPMFVRWAVNGRANSLTAELASMLTIVLHRFIWIVAGEEPARKREGSPKPAVGWKKAMKLITAFTGSMTL